ncbi:MAG: quercetin dioxygenase-like cupin family protein [Cryomorphaceae bacterium]|jgi:quercetin dioxygenase-like cupin family protein
MEKNTRNSLQPKSDIEGRIVRFSEMIPCKTAFIDARTPGSDRKENFCLIGQGVAENPDQIVHIEIPHGFNIGAARQPKGCKNSHHSHNTEEVFMIHSGEWEFTWGIDGQDGAITLHAGDTISLPTHMFRGFENVGNDEALMFSILGLEADQTAGHVLWAPYVFEQAKGHGLVLLEDGRLIDTAAGMVVPEDGKEIVATTQEQAEQLSRLSGEDMLKCIATADELDSLPKGGLSSLSGVEEIAVIGTSNPNEDIASGKMSWEHGFQMRRLRITPGASIPDHQRSDQEVIIVQDGCVDLSTPNFDFRLNKGDLFSAPRNLSRSYKNNGTVLADIIVIRPGNQPVAAEFSS